MPVQRFRSSRPPAPRRAAPRVLVGAAVLGAGALWISPVFRSPGARDLKAGFPEIRPALETLREMILAEPDLDVVGVDNVGEFWFFDGRWTASGNRFSAQSREEMLKAAGLAPARYAAYLEALRRAGAYRVSRQSGRAGRGVVHLLPAGGDGRSAPRLVFSRTAPGPVLLDERARPFGGPAYVRLDDVWYVESPGR